MNCFEKPKLWRLWRRETIVQSQQAPVGRPVHPERPRIAQVWFNVGASRCNVLCNISSKGIFICGPFPKKERRNRIRMTSTKVAGGKRALQKRPRLLLLVYSPPFFLYVYTRATSIFSGALKFDESKQDDFLVGYTV